MDKGIDPKWGLYLGIVVTIQIAIGQGAVKLTNVFPELWIPYIQGWSQFLGFIGTTIMTALFGVSGPGTGPLIKDVPPSIGKPLAILAVAAILSGLLFTPSTSYAATRVQPSTGSRILQLYSKLQAASLADLQFALNIANKKGNKASAMCWQALIDQLQAEQSANLDANGQPIPIPEPHIFTDIQKVSDIVNAFSPASPIMVGCGSFANQAKMNVLQLMTTMVSGAAGVAALAPALAP